MIKSDADIERVLMLSLKESRVRFKSTHPEGDRQKVYRLRKKLMEDMPLLGQQELIVRVQDKDWVVLEWKSSEPLEIVTEALPLEIGTTAQPKRPKVKMPPWFEKRVADYRKFRAEALFKGPEYRLAWEHLDTLMIASEYMIESYQIGDRDPDIEKFVHSSDLKYAILAFRGEEEFESDPIERLRLQIADIPIDDQSREGERLELIRRREKLMLERDQRTLNTNPLV